MMFTCLQNHTHLCHYFCEEMMSELQDRTTIEIVTRGVEVGAGFGVVGHRTSVPVICNISSDAAPLVCPFILFCKYICGWIHEYLNPCYVLPIMIASVNNGH